MEEKVVAELRKVVAREGMSPKAVRRFRRIIYNHYGQQEREMPWRHIDDPYGILVSEVMLQQTPVERVLLKYEPFVSAFPGFASLDSAPLEEVLSLWQGLGYNRRAVALKKIARRVVEEFNGELPPDPDTLATMPGIGKATASAIAAFAFLKPTVFLETNIRSVFIHLFFDNAPTTTVKDAELLPLVAISLDRSNPRDWYYALMDYGVVVKREFTNPARRSAHYKKQSPFHGSNRQQRGKILKTLLATPDSTLPAIADALGKTPERVRENLLQLEREGLIARRGRRFRIA